jgi:hypothetical protein
MIYREPETEPQEAAMNPNLRNRVALAVGAAGVLAAITTMAVTPAFGVSASGSAPIVSAKKPGPIALNNSNQTLVSIKLPAGKWLITGKMWADSVASQPTINTVVGCSIFKGSTYLDNSAFNTPKVNGANGSSAGVNVVTAVISLTSTATISFKCSDFNSHATAHSVVLSAIG